MYIDKPGGRCGGMLASAKNEAQTKKVILSPVPSAAVDFFAEDVVRMPRLRESGF